ncbi:hypothetical protein Z949_1105 [Sulfitobacter guttiformis KCTC 32187]|nr:hypothetical protein Z949_1105 [Sulfitobacter guttiformis KCTC 32187]
MKSEIQIVISPADYILIPAGLLNASIVWFIGGERKAARHVPTFLSGPCLRMMLWAGLKS